MGAAHCGKVDGRLLSRVCHLSSSALGEFLVTQECVTSLSSPFKYVQWPIVDAMTHHLVIPVLFCIYDQIQEHFALIFEGSPTWLQAL